MTIQELNAYGEKLEQALMLRTSPIAVKMLEREEDIPEGALRPKRDKGYHLAQCQAFALARRQGQMVAMLKEDHWCFAALLAYGLVERDTEDEFLNTYASFPSFEYGKYIGMVTAPLKTATYEPDLVLIYADPAQVRQILMWVKFSEKTTVFSEFDPIDSCSYSVVPVMEKGEYRITIPDPGEYARTASREDELIFSVPAAKLQGFIESMERTQGMERDSIWRHIEMRPDFPRPDFYTNLFRKWGLDTEE